MKKYLFYKLNKKKVVLKLIDTYLRMDVEADAKRFSHLIVAALKRKFNYELNSPIYQVINYFVKAKKKYF